MILRWPKCFLTVLLLCLVSMGASASGVFVVLRKGVAAYDDARNGFIQMAYAKQLRGFNPAAVELDGSDKDDAALATLKGQAPDLVFAVGSYAVKKVRQALPEVQIVYAMVYYPEVDGLTRDPRATGVASLGAPRLLAQVVKSLGKGKSIVVLHQAAIAASALEIASALGAEGLSASTASVQGTDDLPKVLDGIKGQAQYVLLLPDPLTQAPESLRFIISKCIEAGIMPLAYSESLVSNGALAAAYIPPQSAGSRAAEVASDILSSGKAPDTRVVSVADAATAVNGSTAKALRINKLPKDLSSGTIYE
ncbi:MAG: hypothetical protein JHC34_03530 [Acidobacteria bacterium]|nr:hypothetical protein [Acidobacteriota bacterium]